jgi:hypothetical protein
MHWSAYWGGHHTSTGYTAPSQLFRLWQVRCWSGPLLMPTGACCKQTVASSTMIMVDDAGALCGCQGTPQVAGLATGATWRTEHQPHGCRVASKMGPSAQPVFCSPPGGDVRPGGHAAVGSCCSRVHAEDQRCTGHGVGQAHPTPLTFTTTPHLVLHGAAAKVDMCERPNMDDPLWVKLRYWGCGCQPRVQQLGEIRHPGAGPERTAHAVRAPTHPPPPHHGEGGGDSGCGALLCPRTHATLCNPIRTPYAHCCCNRVAGVDVLLPHRPPTAATQRHRAHGCHTNAQLASARPPVSTQCCTTPPGAAMCPRPACGLAQGCCCAWSCRRECEQCRGPKNQCVQAPLHLSRRAQTKWSHTPTHLHPTQLTLQGLVATA